MTPEIAREWIEITQRSIERQEMILDVMFCCAIVVAVIGIGTLASAWFIRTKKESDDAR